MDYVVIMAGGTGKRLWPLSRQSRPKQVLRLLNGQTLLRRCFERIRGIFEPRNILVLTNADYVAVVRENLSELPADNVIAEPMVRDTAGAIGLAATILHKYDPQSTMAVVTADQVIEPDEPFQEAVRTAINFVNENPDALITFGIEPTFACTQYGYIKLGAAKSCARSADAVRIVEAFREKPDEKTAAKYLAGGQYCWNSGLFVWKTKTILDRLHTLLPACVEPLHKIQLAWGRPEQESTLQEWFTKLPKISIDFAVMEKAKQVYSVRLNCRWMDLGSFTALADIIQSDSANNIVVAEQTELLDCKNSIVATEDKNHLIALIGLDNMVVVHSPDATLVCPVSQSHRLKELLECIQQHSGKRFL